MRHHEFIFDCREGEHFVRLCEFVDQGGGQARVKEAKSAVPGPTD